MKSKSLSALWTLLVLCALCLPAFAALEVSGGTNFNTVIPNGDTTPRTLDGTDYGTVTVPGTKSNTFQLRNTGNSAVTLTLLQVDSNAFSMTSGGVNGTLINLGAGSTRNFTIELAPVSAGPKTGTILISAIGQPPYTFEVSGTALGEPEIVVRGRTLPTAGYVSIADGDTTPTTVDGTAFGDHGVAEGYLTHTFQIENTGTASLTIDSVTSDNPEFTISGAPSSVGVGVTQSFSVRFNPDNIGAETATITIQNNDANEDPFTFRVSGTGEAANITVFGGDTQSTLILTGDTTPRTTDNTDFGTVVAGAADVSKTFKITNLGTTNLVIYDITENANAFSITNKPSSIVPIPPDASVNFNVVLSTSTAGLKYGTVSIVSNDPDTGVFTFDVTANATGNPEIEVKGQLGTGLTFVPVPDGTATTVNSNGTDFGSQPVSGGGITHTFQIVNTGNASLTIDSITDNSTQFSVGSVPSSVAVSTPQTFTVTFNPTSIGVKTATITIRNNDSNEDPYTFAVSGTGTGSEAEVKGGSGFAEVIASGDVTPTTVDGTDYGSVVAGNGTKSNTFRLFNRGNTNLLVNAVSEDGSAFSITSAPATGSFIAPGASRDIAILFAPTSAGTKRATVSVLTNDPAVPLYTFDITGNATGTAVMEISGQLGTGLPFVPVPDGAATTTTANGTDFGSVAVANASSAHTFRIANTGSAQLSITSITDNSTQFSVSGVPATVGVGQTQDFTVTFNPDSIGAKAATITALTSTGDTYTFAVSGTGTGPRLNVVRILSGSDPVVSGDTTPSTDDGTDYGTIEAGTVRDRTFRMENTGNANLLYTAVTENGNAWRISSAPAPGTSIAPGGALEFTLALEPTSADFKTATVTIITNDPDNPFTFSVSGTATGEPQIAVLGQLGTGLPFVGVPDGATTTTTGNGTDFGEVSVSAAKLTHTFQISNPGNAQLVINSISETSPHFSVSGVPATVGAGKTGTFSVSFDPTSYGAKSATISLDTNAGSRAYTFKVSGTGDAPDIAVTGGNLFANNIANGDATPRTADGTDFGYVNITGSSLTQTFRLENTGNDTLTILAFSSSHPAFTLAGVPALTNPIAPGATNEFTITFDPSATGQQSSVISFQSNDPDEVPFTFTVGGFGSNSTPDIRVTGSSSTAFTNGQTGTSLAAGTAFGSADINGGTVVRTFSIENTGSGPLTVSSVTENSPHFAVSGAATGALAPGASDDFTITFDPSAVGVQNATVTIASDDPDSPSFTFAITGTGTDTPPPATGDLSIYGGPSLNVLIASGDTTPRSADGTDLGTVEVGTLLTRTFRLRNLETGVLHLTAVEIVGVPGAVASFPATIAANSFVDIPVNLTASSPGQKVVTFRVQSDDPGTPVYTFAITANAVVPVNTLALTDVAAVGNNIEITFSSDPAKTYRIAYSLDLQTWNRPAAYTGLPGDINPQTYTLTNAVTLLGARGYFRVEEE